ncbi:hypothetical protein GCM10023185_14950 [Hymenobacter saemangeumensis]|uniref:Tetratricopeptide repeat protein n=1 Tax=Hymenobacter saemangeumensis TaxID=1084522 RepID=A0ABP8I9C8_9BACT
MSFRFLDGFKERFIALYKAGKKAEAEQVLKEWEQQQPNDPEAYIMRFNLLVMEADYLKENSGDGAVTILTEQEAEKALKKGEIQRQADSTKAQMQRAYRLMRLGSARLREGIRLAPDRLDMRFGLAMTYQNWDEPTAQVQVLKEALADRAQSGKPWLWRDGLPLPEPEAKFLPKALEGYANHYWVEKPLVLPQDMRPRDEKKAKEYGRQLAELIKTHYPQSSLGPFNLGVYYQLNEKWAPAAAQMKQADALEPNDPYTVLALTRIAVELKQKKEAMTYLARLKAMPDMEKEVANYTQKIQALR